MKSVRMLDAGPVGVGTRGEATVRMFGITVTDPVTITEFEPPTRFAIRHEGAFKGRGVITLEAGADGTTTIVRWEERLVAAVLPHLGALVIEPPFRPIFQADLVPPRATSSRPVPPAAEPARMQLHLVDATYELFRAHFAPRPPVLGRDGINLSGVSGLCDQLLYLLREEGATHVGCATDRVIESFRNDLYPGLQVVGRDAARAARPVPDRRGRRRGARHRPVADGRVRGRRRHRRRGRPVRRRTRASSGSSSARRTRTWPSSSATTGSCSGTGAATSTYDDAGVRAKWGVAAHLDPRLPRPRRRCLGRLPGATGLGLEVGRGRARPLRPLRGHPGEGVRLGGARASAARARSRSLPPSASDWDEALLYRDLARLRTADDGVPIRQRDPDELRWDGAPRADWEAFCEEWGLDRSASAPASVARRRLRDMAGCTL